MAQTELTDNSPMPFGKHKGKPMIQVPAPYLIWLYDQGIENGPVKSYIADNLEALKKEVSRTPKR